MKRLFKSYLWMVLLGSLAWASCSDKEVGGSVGGSFDPSQPIVISDFYPDSGGIATPMIITGKTLVLIPLVFHYGMLMKMEVVTEVDLYPLMARSSIVMCQQA